MTEQANERLKVTTQKREPDAAKQIREFVDDHPLLSLAFVVAAGYAVGRLISRL
jgi:ElaB/YqjD/DUF883 family membrane-anchored ribosome-binding protein